MKIQDGMTYFQNYDLIFKWLGPELEGHSLNSMGIKTGIIKKVSGFEPADIKVTAGRLDLVLKNVENEYFNVEAHRNLRKADLYKFAAYHFFTAKNYGNTLTSVILASGDVSIKETVIKTNSGEFRPVIIDLSKRDWEKRLNQIRAAIKTGDFKDWYELPFLSIYGREVGKERSAMIEEILRFEKEMYDQGKISQNLLMATFIMSNKLIDQKSLNALWEEFKMLDIIKLARDKGFEEAKTQIEQAETKAANAEAKAANAEAKAANAEAKVVREIVIDVLMERFNIISANISDQVKKIRDIAVIKGLYRLAKRCKSIHEFEHNLNQMV